MIFPLAHSPLMQGRSMDLGEGTSQVYPEPPFPLSVSPFLSLFPSCLTSLSTHFAVLHTQCEHSRKHWEGAQVMEKTFLLTFWCHTMQSHFPLPVEMTRCCLCVSSDTKRDMEEWTEPSGSFLMVFNTVSVSFFLWGNVSPFKLLGFFILFFIFEIMF